jgi:uncharacterized membrane protein YfhO
MDLIRWRGGIGLVIMLSIGYVIEEWYYYTPQSKPMAEDTFRQYIQWRKEHFKNPLTMKSEEENK